MFVGERNCRRLETPPLTSPINIVYTTERWRLQWGGFCVIDKKSHSPPVKGGYDSERRVTTNNLRLGGFWGTVLAVPKAPPIIQGFC
jgi:hypothetical protein